MTMRFMIETINAARQMRRFIVEQIFVHAGYRQYGNCNRDAINSKEVASEVAAELASDINADGAAQAEKNRLKSKAKSKEKIKWIAKKFTSIALIKSTK